MDTLYSIPQEAQMIELHSAGIILVADGYEDGIVGYTEHTGESIPAYNMPGDTFDAILDYLKIGEKSREVYDTKGRPRVQDIINEKFVFEKCKTVVGNFNSSRHIVSMSVAILDSNLIDIFVKIKKDDSVFDRRITYAGVFSVWWK